MLRQPRSAPSARAPSSQRTARLVELQAQDCAGQVLAVVPAVMDVLRGAMRLHVGDQLSVPQFRCLNYIAHQPGASMGEVAAFLGVTLPTASAMVDRLVRAGSVMPGTASQDRRRSSLQLTSDGKAQLRQIQRGARKEMATALAVCSEEELQALSASLALLQRTFQSR